MDTLTWRPIDVADLVAVQAVAARSDLADGGPYALNLEEVAEIVDGADHDTGTFLVAAGDEVVAWGVVGWDPPDEPRDQDRIILWGGVDPDHRRRGIGRELLRRQLDAAERIAGGHSWPTDARIYGNVPDPGRAALAAAFDMPQTRWFEDLRRDLSPLDRPAPDGVTITAWLPEHDEPARVLKNRTFADHWGSSTVSSAAWANKLSGYGTRRDLSLVALAEGDVVGLALNGHFPEDVASVGYDAGWIDTLGTDARWRGRGVASALIARSLQVFRDEGFDAAMLGVDADSPTGANRLYRDLGFTAEHQSTCWVRQL